MNIATLALGAFVSPLGALVVPREWAEAQTGSSRSRSRARRRLAGGAARIR